MPRTSTDSTNNFLRFISEVVGRMDQQLAAMDERLTLINERLTRLQIRQEQEILTQKAEIQNLENLRRSLSQEINDLKNEEKVDYINGKAYVLMEENALAEKFGFDPRTVKKHFATACLDLSAREIRWYNKIDVFRILRGEMEGRIDGKQVRKKKLKQFQSSWSTKKTG